MHVLLVDDDYFVVTALEKKIDWASLQVDAVYTAHNVAQAREILKTRPVQILISDIEMPQGSGLELLAWIREEKYEVQTIFLTNYADFNYAQKAIELQSFEYFLKPIEFDKLMLIIQKAVARSKEQQKNEKAIQDGRFWQKNQAKIIEYFWRRLVVDSVSVPVKPSDVARSVQEQHLAYGMSDRIQPLLIQLFPYNGSMGKEEKNLFDFALLNVLYELIQSPCFSVETILEYRDCNWIVILKWHHPVEVPLLRELCSLFIERGRSYLKCDACCSIGFSAPLESIGQLLHRLLSIHGEMTPVRNETYLMEDYPPPAVPREYRPPDLTLLEDLLHRNDPVAFLGEVEKELRLRLGGRRVLNISELSLFRLDIVQLVYSFLKLKGIQAHKLYTGKTNDSLLMHSLSSIEDFEEYLKYLVHTALDYRDFAAQPKSVVEEIKQYIHAHYGEDLSRNDLAEIVYLHPDYLARVFKRETGVSLGSYVIQVRIQVAKGLLETTELSVYTIANRVGYANDSYFSKLFKQEVGLTPNEYKRVACLGAESGHPIP